MLFMKPTTTYITEGQSIKTPPECTLLYFEVELGIVINKTAKNVSEDEAMDYVGGYFLALDMTAFDFQVEARKKGLPWCLSKGWDTATPVSEFIDKEKVKNYADTRLWLKLNGETKQDDSTKDMIFSIPFVISYISKYITLEECDVILTGTPSGVGPVYPGDVITAGLEDLVSMSFPVE
ncbi:hypothetical protein KUTeg_005370 [Tegillarca granosa]|uniref:oxaloacetate tautomerase n=1 Tax=Tegillarca granosa TaxID=220873 RepID=A0ABQ9FJK0_TEGGR|nr:hypothetical protein KUTeg_005370 [Tegillarca granosa]